MTAAPAPHPHAERRFGGAFAAIRLAAMLIVSALLMPLQALLLCLTRGAAAYRIPQLWHRCLCAVIGLRVRVVGTPHVASPTLYVGNHVSHFDILAVGTALRASFIAKDDMQAWPGTPFVAGLQQTVFVSRNPRDAAKVAAQVAAQMDRGNHMVLFAEGTTSRGDSVSPFKSTLLALVAARSDGRGPAWTIQPFTIDLLAVDGQPLRDDADRDGYAYYGDMDAGRHVMRFLRGRGARLRLVMHAPIRATPELSRKALAAMAHAAVLSGITPAPRHRSAAAGADQDVGSTAAPDR